MLIDNAQALIQAVAEVMQVTPDDIIGRKKRSAESLARQIVMTLWSEAHSLQASCEIVGRCHHTATFYARRNIHNKLQYCPITKERMRKILKKYSEIILASEQENQ
jgi:chromosomal replication initiation ATPase DnaA